MLDLDKCAYTVYGVPNSVWLTHTILLSPCVFIYVTFCGPFTMLSHVSLRALDGPVFCIAVDLDLPPKRVTLKLIYVINRNTI